ncbi:MAG: O-antigen ligase family protein [bacterium]
MFYYALFFLFSLGQIGRISIYNQQVNFYLYEILLFSLFLYLFNKFKFKPLSQNKKKWLLYFPIVLFLSFLITFNRYSQIGNLVSFLYFLRTSFYFIFIVYLNFFIKKQKDLKELINYGLILFITLTIVTSFLQYFLYPNLRNLVYLGWDPHIFRIFGVFLDTSIASAIFGLILLYLILNYKKFIFSTFSKVLLIIAYSFLGLLTYSRGFYISIFITLIYYLLLKKKIKYLMIILFIFVSALFFLPKPFGEGVNLLRTYSITSRIADYKQGFSIWKENPVFGIGYGHLKEFRESIAQLPSHSLSAFQSSFMTILATAGLLGLVVFFLALKNLWFYSKSAKYYVLFLSIFSLMDNILLHPFILFLLLFLVNDS